MNQATSIYNDFSGLANLQARASQRAPEATREAMRQFEALFVQMMLKSMRSAGAILGEERDTTYEEMFDQQIAMELTKEKGIGIADMLVRQLSTAEIADKPALRNAIAPQDRVSSAALRVEAPARQDWKPGDQKDFLRDVWPLAENAAMNLQVDPRGLVAQAALETGWGQKLIRDPQGVSAHNLFGIKADNRWTGERISVSTLEYDGALPQRQWAQFRAYPDLQAGFEDYVSFLKSNPRYSDAIRSGLDAEKYASSLQDAGYATDPNYADKIRGIIKSPLFNQLLDELKIEMKLPTYW
jgi:flagellar protein FlgJ